MKLFWRTLATICLAVLPALSQAPARINRTSAPIDYEAIRLQRVVTAVRISEPITLDGHLEEPAWALAIPATDFTQYQPFHGQLSTERTEVRFLYDDNNLYVGFNCFDSQ